MLLYVQGQTLPLLTSSIDETLTAPSLQDMGLRQGLHSTTAEDSIKFTLIRPKAEDTELLFYICLLVSFSLCAQLCIKVYPSWVNVVSANIYTDIPTNGCILKPYSCGCALQSTSP